MPRSDEVAREIGADKLDELTDRIIPYIEAKYSDLADPGLGRDRRRLCRQPRPPPASR